MIKYALQMWMRHVVNVDDVEHELLRLAVKELERLEKVEFWANEFLHRPNETNRSALEGLIEIELMEDLS